MSWIGLVYNFKAPTTIQVVLIMKRQLLKDLIHFKIFCWNQNNFIHFLCILNNHQKSILTESSKFKSSFLGKLNSKAFNLESPQKLLNLRTICKARYSGEARILGGMLCQFIDIFWEGWRVIFLSNYPPPFPLTTPLAHNIKLSHLCILQMPARFRHSVHI